MIVTSTITLESYLQRKKILSEPIARREFCLECRKPKLTCYCSSLKPIHTKPRFVILMHPLEAKHPVGTGRMAHRVLSNSELWVGTDFQNSKSLQSLLSDPKVHPMLLFPGPQSCDLSQLTENSRSELLPSDKEAVVIVLDGTWHLAKKMLYRTPRLQTLPQISFTPTRPSRFIVRRQPHDLCFSTIEAIHEVLTLMSADQSQSEPPEQDVLLEIFDEMVKKQLSFRNNRSPSRHLLAFQKRKARLEQKANIDKQNKQE